MVAASSGTVRFYVGDPDQGGTKIADAPVGPIAPMSWATVTVPYNTAGKTVGQTLNIYAVVDPDKLSSEVHEDYNKAYAMLPIVNPPTGPGEPGNLFVSAVDIVLDPPAPAAGDTVQISATIHAAREPFTWVVVEFWDGNPTAGGLSIGGRLIPLIAADGAATVSVAWPVPGGFGPSQLWVTTRAQPADRVIADNRAFQTVELAPYPAYLPVISR